MGSDAAAEFAPDPDEAPRHCISCAAFSIGRTPVTNAQYRLFVDASGHPPPSHWPGGEIPAGRELHPVTYVSHADAAAFCRWAGGRLPTEAEWERAARGDDDRTWPWGDAAPTPDLATFAATDTSPVGLRPHGAGPFGALDLAGNAWEWTSSALRPYPYDPGDDREDESSVEPRVVRGGAYIHGPGEIRCSSRHGMLAGAVDHYVGFRLACEPGAAIGLELDVVEVPAGDALLGNDSRSSAGPALADETPRHTLAVATVLLAATPVTNTQYRDFVRATGHPAPPHWAEGTMPEELAGHPVTYVDWDDANAFAVWCGARLPTEAEWEKAARGTDGRRYPWGDEPPELPSPVAKCHKGSGRANFGRGPKHGSTTRVDAHPEGASPYGLLDMAGNVWEWVNSAYAPYPYRLHDGREDPASGGPRVLRGGSYASGSSRFIRCAMRSRSAPGRRSAHIGFRIARFPGS